VKRGQWIGLAALGAGGAAIWLSAARRRPILNLGSTDTTAHADADRAGDLQRTALRLKALPDQPRDEALAELGRAATALRQFELGTLRTREARLPFWINVYNALTFHAIVYFRPRWTVWEVPGFFDRAAYEIGGLPFSLNEIEHGVLRANRPAPGSRRRPFSPDDPRLQFALTEAEFDPRIHFALNCGARSCPPVGVYEAQRVDEQLELAATGFLRAETEVRSDRIVTSAILKWYRTDFGDLHALLGRYLPAESAARARGKRLTFRPYDWRAAR
jgi:hypothetical protein